MITQNHDSLCGEAKPYYYDYLCDESSELVPEFITKHIEQCQHCREQIKQLQFALSNKECIESKQGQNTSAVTTMLQLHLAYIGDRVTCEMVRPFLPGMLDPAIDIRIPTPITAHLDNCPQCIEDLKTIEGLNLYSAQLYRLSQLFSEGPSGNTKELSEISPAVSAMAKRENSGIITVFHIDESAKARSTDNSDGLYSGYPIHVDILNPKEDVEQPDSQVDTTDTLKEEKVKKIKLKPFLEIGLMAAAAMILIGTALFFNTTSAEADIGEKISKAIENLTNVHISTYAAKDNELLQERWISNSLKVYISKTKKEFNFSDVNTGQMKSINYDTGEINEDRLDGEARAHIEQRIRGSLDLKPLYDISNLPSGYKWLRREDHPEVTEGFEIYDLKWNAPKKNSYESRRWRFFIDSATFLLRKIEVSGKEIGQNDYSLEMVIVVESKSDSDIREVIREAGF